MQVIRPHQWRDKWHFKLARPCCEWRICDGV